MSLPDSLLDKLAPHYCVGCGQEGRLLCLPCSRTPPPPNIAANGYLSSIRSATLYGGVAKDLIWKLKSDGAQAAAKIMAQQMSPLITTAGNYLIVPVPTATSRVCQRGYDQAKLIARALSRQTGLPYFDCLVRHGQAHQVGASRQERLKQIQDSLSFARRRDSKCLDAILIDDVTTTGATLETAAAVLQKAGFKHIEAITFAQA